jgi:hypothetical protein
MKAFYRISPEEQVKRLDRPLLPIRRVASALKNAPLDRTRIAKNRNRQGIGTEEVNRTKPL